MTTTVDTGTQSQMVTHLERAGALIGAGHLQEAEVEVLRGLALVPTEIRALKLLALVRFKLGRFAEAREAYRALAKATPDDANVRMNLGLIALRLEWIDEAVAELEVAVRLRPDEQKTWSYLGFAYARSGRREAAAEAFRRCGQEDLARQALAGVVTPAVPAPPVAVAAQVIEETAGDPVPGEPSPEVEGFGPPRPDLSARTDGAPDHRPAGSNLSSFVLARLLPDLDRPDAVTPAGVFTHQGELLRFDLDGEAIARSNLVVAVHGAIKISPAKRREQGRQMTTPLEDKDARFYRCQGKGTLWLSDAAGTRLSVTRLEDDVLFLRQDRVVVFSDDIVWETGRIPMAGVPLLQLRGTGRVVIAASPDSVVAMKVSGDDSRTLLVESDRVLGWVGRVVPHIALAGTGGSLLACEGEGILLVLRHRSAER